jgi:hypothetical protein
VEPRTISSPEKTRSQNGVAGAFNPTNHLFNRGIANLPGGLFEGGDAHASQLRPLQFIKPQADIAAPVQANALERAGNLQRQRPGGNHRFAHPAMAVWNWRRTLSSIAFVKRRFGVFGDHAGIAPSVARNALRRSRGY